MRHYPRTVNWLAWRKNKDGTYQVKDCLAGDVYTMGDRAFHFLRRLDGRHDPLSVLPGVTPREAQELLDALSCEGLLRDSNVLCKSFLSVYFTLWSPKKTRARSAVPGILDALRMLLWLPICLFGVLTFWNSSTPLSSESPWFGILLGIFVGAIAHELSHGLSCLHWGGRVFEVGIMIHYGIPGMYVLMDQVHIYSHMQKALVSSAGIEMNLMLVGIFGGLSAVCPTISLSFFMAAFMNLWLALINLLPAPSVDGMRVMCALLGDENATQTAEKAIRSRHLRKQCRAQGFRGCIKLLACSYLTVGQHIFFPALIILSLGEVLTLCRSWLP